MCFLNSSKRSDNDPNKCPARELAQEWLNDSISIAILSSLPDKPTSSRSFPEGSVDHDVAFLIAQWVVRN
jgi:hypothetical protein